MTKGSGDQQSAPFGTALANPLRVSLTQGGNPAAGLTVTWAVSPAGGSANPASSVTAADGTTSSTITLPPIGGAVTITATSAGATGSPVTFTANATGAATLVTVSVVNTQYIPDVFQVKQNGIVTFTWGAGATSHTVTPVAPNLIPTSSNPSPPATHNAPYTFDTVFPTVGVFKFFCSTHGAVDTGMHGTITVVP
jgi:plastocyanin